MKDSTKDLLMDSLAELPSRIRDGIQDRAAAALETEWRAGYETAAEVCLEVLASNIADLQGRLRTGTMSKDEQVVLSRLHELQKATKEELLAGPWSAPIGKRREHSPKGRLT